MLLIIFCWYEDQQIIHLTSVQARQGILPKFGFIRYKGTASSPSPKLACFPHLK